MKKLLLIIMGIALILSGCNTGTNTGNPLWDRLVDSVKGTSVNFYVWEEDDEALTWFNTVVKTHLKTQHDMTLNVIEVDYEDVFDLLLDDLTNERSIGEIDLLWLDEEAFNDFNNKGLLYGPYTDKLLNYGIYMNPKSLGNKYMGASPVEGMAVAFNQQVLTYYYNEDQMYDPPTTLEDFKAAAAANQGMFTYPHPSDPVGGAFVRSVLLNFTDSEDFVEEPLSKAAFKDLAMPGLNYLKTIRSDLYNNGKTYPKTAREMEDLFADEAILVTMSMNYRHGNELTGEAIYPMGTKPFIFGSASVGRRDYLAIAHNAKNKSGAMVVIDELLDLGIQTDKFKNRKYYGIPVYDVLLLDDAATTSIKKAISKKTVLDGIQLMKHQVHDIPQAYHQWVVDLWEEMVMAPTDTGD